MNKKTIACILLLLSGCQKLSTSVPGRVASSSSSISYVTPHVHSSSMTSTFSSSINTSSNNTSNSVNSSSTSQSSSDNHDYIVVGEIDLEKYSELYNLNKNIEILEELSSEQLELKIQELKIYHQYCEIYRFNERFKRSDSKIISIESNVDRKDEIMSLIVNIENSNGDKKYEEAYIKDNRYYERIHNVGEEEHITSDDLSTIGDYEFVLSNLNAFYSNSMTNPFQNIDTSNMQYGYDSNSNLIIQNEEYRLVISEEEYIYKITKEEYFVIEYNVAKFNFPDFVNKE